MIRFFRGLYITNRFFMLYGGLAALFAFSFAYHFLFYMAEGLLIFSITLLIADLFLLFNSEVKLKASRTVASILSLGDPQVVTLEMENTGNQSLRVKVIDELPMQLQEREFAVSFNLKEGEKKLFTYAVRPITRGEYFFGNINLFAHTTISLVKRRFIIEAKKEAAVYPSIIQMKKFELKAFSRISNLGGVKRIRRLGHSYEFEQIKNYVKGDDFRGINWKATGRTSSLMVNQYEDERSQQIYCLLDKSRAMHMPFEGLSLLDHSINTSLVISNIALNKYDKAGLLTFSDHIDSFLKAERGRNQLKKILEQLYKEKERPLESNYELLYNGVRNYISGRSLLFLFTNFESLYAMERAFPLLRRLNAQHLLVVIFFENTEIIEYTRQPAKNVEEIYYQTIAQKLAAEKVQMVQQLKQLGIQTLLTRPDELSMNTVNKYLELKARGLI